MGPCCCCRASVATVVEVADEESGTHSIVHIKTRDRPGLLTDIVKVLKDINVNVVSAEVRHAPASCMQPAHACDHAAPLAGRCPVQEGAQMGFMACRWFDLR